MTNVCFISHRKVDLYCSGGDNCGDAETTLQKIIRTLEGCAAVLCTKIGYEPWEMLEEAGIHGPVDLNTYLRLVAPYETQLRQFAGREGEYGARFALLFLQVVRLQVKPGGLNQLIPKPFITVAQRYLAREHEVVTHFSYEENRHFFLSDLHDWLQIQERGERMRQMGK